MDRELLLFCDEFDKDGCYFSNFYGGVLVVSSDYERITRRLEGVKESQNIGGEVKWSKTSEAYVEKYAALVSAFFDEVREGRLKVRIMFRHNANEPRRLTEAQKELGYFLLYYQFIKHAFGLRQMPTPEHDVNLRLYFDEFPDKPENAAEFKGFLYGLQMDEAFQARRLRVRIDDIVEVRSHDHVLMQCLDVVLGSMTFRLNDKHKEVPEGQRRPGKRTVAKERLYGRILAEIRTVRPNFNVGITTGKDDGFDSLWGDRYRHWVFVPSMSVYDESRKRAVGRGASPDRPECLRTQSTHCVNLQPTGPTYYNVSARPKNSTGRIPELALAPRSLEGLPLLFFRVAVPQSGASSTSARTMTAAGSPRSARLVQSRRWTNTLGRRWA